MTGAVKSLRATELSIEKLVHRYAVDEDPNLLPKFVRSFWNEDYEDDIIDCKQLVKQYTTAELQTLIRIIIKMLHSSATTKHFKNITTEIEATRYIISQLLQEPSILPSNEVLQQAAEILGVAQLPEFFQIYTRPSEIFTIHTAWKYFTLLLQWKQEISRFNRVTDNTCEAKEIVKCDQLLASYIKKHPNEFETFIVQPEQLKALAELEDVKHCIENKAFGGVTEKVMSELAREESDESYLFLWRTWQAMNPIIAVQIPLYFGCGIHLVEMFIEKGGEEVMQTIYSSKLVGRQFGDWFTAKLHRIALPDILPEDAVLATMTSEKISDKLYEYLFGLQAFEENTVLKRQAQLNDYFCQNGIIGEGEDIGQVILEDAQTLLQLNLEGGRHQMYRKVQAALDIGLYQHQMSLESYRRKLDDEDLKPLFERIRSEFQIESPQTEFPADFPLRVYFLGTMGHHQDALHPVAPMRSYYLEGDHVGGSADCLIVNLKQVRDPSEWTLEKMEMKLSQRLNSSTPAAWEKETGVVYLSDMAPYLMRVACCFEGKNSRYRVDPKKLWSVIGDY